MSELPKNPAQFTPAIIEALGPTLSSVVPSGASVHDPFAGAGHRLGSLCDSLGIPFSGTDLEAWDRDPRVKLGDSTSSATYPQGPHVVVTSPSYNNGCNDHFVPDGSKRFTYRAALGRELHTNNTGRYSGRGSKKAEKAYWDLTHRVVGNWPATVVVNLKNSIRSGEVYDLVGKWRELLGLHTYSILEEHTVPVRGIGMGANRDARINHEVILVAFSLERDIIARIGDRWEDGFPHYLAIDKGWLPIVSDLVGAMPQHIRVAQVKSKFGGLRFYYHPYDPEFEEVVRQAEERASKTCEDCGEPGRHTVIGFWHATLCPECEDLEEVRRLER